MEIEYIYYLIYIIVAASLSVGTSHFLEYCLGFPMSATPNASAIFFPITFFLAKSRLRRSHPNLFKLISEMYLKESDDIKMIGGSNKGKIETVRSDSRLINLKQFKTAVAIEARQFYTYEMMIGMCTICTSFWVSSVWFWFVVLISGTINLHYILIWFSIVLLSHYLIRKI